MGSDFLAFGFGVPLDVDVDFDLDCGFEAAMLEEDADFLRPALALFELEAGFAFDLDLGFDDEEEVGAGVSERSERESLSMVRSTKTDGSGGAAMVATREGQQKRERR